MRLRPCKHCLSADLRKSQFQIFEYPLLLVGARPFRCGHCLQRQYAIDSPLVLFVIRVFRKVDEMISLIHPAMRKELRGRRRRRRQKAANLSSDQQQSRPEQSAP